jgi:hypothetical protein
MEVFIKTFLPYGVVPVYIQASVVSKRRVNTIGKALEPIPKALPTFANNIFSRHFLSSAVVLGY